MKVRLILGDQLSHSLAGLADATTDDLLLMCEVRQEATYVKHHKKKIAFLFSAMRHFAAELSDNGYNVRYIEYDDPENSGSLLGEVCNVTRQMEVSEVILTAPGEYRVSQDFAGWSRALGVPVTIRDDDRFLATPEEFATWAEGRKQLRMEYFYRDMRRKYCILMDHDGPIGGQWNYDAENRKPPATGLDVPDTFRAPVDAITQDVIALVETHFADHFGELSPFHFAVTRDQALVALEQFIAKRLQHFGDYQDAMIQGEPWMYHSHIGFYLNCGLLGPLECIERAEAAYHKGMAPLNAVEGFIRQILGWREYVRGIYWHAGPEYVESNALAATRPLPAFYWTGKTDMHCLSQAIGQTIEHSYAHHIQRLMITGNFALLAGLNPKEVHKWYLAVYADAYEWVELPNSLGMSQFADGGMLASKPYAASGAYINRMSDYCTHCSYDVKQRTGPKACPFNALYWEFIARNERKLRKNPRMAMPYKNWERMADADKVALRAHAQQFLEKLG